MKPISEPTESHTATQQEWAAKGHRRGPAAGFERMAIVAGSDLKPNMNISNNQTMCTDTPQLPSGIWR